jgi:F0F1-type ATP synthase delta subunit
MPEEKAMEIRKISQTAANEIKVTTAFNLNNDQRNFIVSLLKGRIGGDVSVAFEGSANNVCGIELRLPGYKIGWSVESYLDRFEKTVSGALEIMNEPTVGQNNPHS